MSTANQVRLALANQSNASYEVDWAKIEPWGEEHMRKNVGSHCHVDVDSDGRFFRSFCSIGATLDIATHTGMEGGHE